MDSNKAVAESTSSMRKISLENSPIKEVHAFWLAGMSCDGCSIAAVGAQNPSVEQLLRAAIPGLPRVILHHPVLSVTAGDEFLEAYHKAKNGELGAPYVLLFEGSVADETIAGKFGGYWSAMGVNTDEKGVQKPIPTSNWLADLAPAAAAVVAVGTCATWGGIPAAAGNVTNSMSVMDFLGKDYLSALGLPPINIPGCAPVGDNLTETISSILMFLVGLGPLPEFDGLGRPAWLYRDTVHRGCVRAGTYEEGVFAKNHGEKECLVELGCWGPVVQCNMVSRGALGHNGGCMNTGGICIGCTMPGFPDAFAPFYKAPPGAVASGTASRAVGSFIRPLRKLTQGKNNMTSRWEEKNEIPSGWGHQKLNLMERVSGYFYNKLKNSGTKFSPNSNIQKKLQKSSKAYLSGKVKEEISEEVI